MSLLRALNLPPLKQPPGQPTTAKQAPTTARPARAAQQAAKPAAKPAAKRADKLNQNNYGVFVVAFAGETENWRKPLAALDTGGFDPKDLVAKHRALVLGLHNAILLAKTDPAKALQFWEKVQPALRSEARKAAAAGVPSAGISLALAGLDEIDKALFVAAAFHAAAREAEANSTLVAPDTAQYAGRLKRAEGELMSAEELYQNSLSTAAHVAKLGGFDGASKVKDIIDLVATGGDITAKLAEARKRGIATTAAELVSKVGGATGFLVETSFEVGKSVVQAQRAVLLQKAASSATKQALDELEALGKRFEKNAAIGKAIAKGATAAAVIADGIRLFGALRDGKFSEAGSALLDMAVDAAPLVLGEAGGTIVTGIIFIAKTELAAISMAAEFIRYCRDETVRQAAESFIQDCNAVAPRARKLLASIDVMLAATNPGVQQMAQQRVNTMAASVAKDLRALGSHVTSKSRNLIGGYPNVVQSMGPAATAAFTVSFDEKDGAMLVAQQIADVFGGANRMANYVKAHYTN